ncbi:hypothetical protein [Marinisporobacter balticus]|uniref:Methyl-accepting chemotaxis protein (MCP) signaling protein n=1 Tax=Marinisporobacter balticus TaxID=2018667 RepID=A0A4R2L0R8_9FIRM|nr:hypothetical protein [Marinisporobacter balticus]TCO80014.1 hypothetical protein EV214_101250 [Marinisporobacter balticus]
MYNIDNCGHIVLASLEEITSSIEEISSGANNISISSGEIRLQSIDTKKQVEQTDDILRYIKNISDQTKTTEQIVNALQGLNVTMQRLSEIIE